MITPEKDKLEYAIRFGFKATNNEAEYKSLIVGLRLARELGARNIQLRSDSQLVVGKVQGMYGMKDDRMRRYLTAVKMEKSYFRHFNIQVPRMKNEEDDRLARLASSDAEKMPPGVTLEHLPRPSIEVEEDIKVNVISPEHGWAAEILRYLRDSQLPKDRDEARYSLLDDVLYKRGFSLPLLRCLSEEEADYVLREIHERICGNHSRGRSMAHKAIRAGYNWPSTQKDAAHLA